MSNAAQRAAGGGNGDLVVGDREPAEHADDQHRASVHSTAQPRLTFHAGLTDA